MDKEPTPEQKKMIERAVKDTVEAIVDAAATTFDAIGVKSKVVAEAEHHWEMRYTKMFTHAVVKLDKNWDKDKKLVLGRARQVGVIAANLANIKSILFAWVRGEIGKPGQHVHVGNAPTPEITIDMAEMASLCIDCLQSGDDDPGVRWDWCSTALAQRLPSVRLSTPPTVKELITSLLQHALQAETEIGQRAATLLEER